LPGVYRVQLRDLRVLDPLRAAFLVWVAVLGLSLSALLGALATADTSAITRRLAGQVMTGTAWFLTVVGALLASLWLSEMVPDSLSGEPSRSATDWNVPTNPVHVLDLAFFLPAVITSAVLLRRQHPLGYATAARQLVWLALTCLPILVTPLVATTRGHPGLGRDAPTSANGTHPADPCEQVHVVSRTRLCGR